jgi:dTDP-4-dehydrorhamnose 3,5-epimerase
MKATPLAIPDVMLLESKIFGDDRGFFFESFNQAQFDAAIGRRVNFVQDRQPFKICQERPAWPTLPNQAAPRQAMRVVAGEVFGVDVDIRKSSPTFGLWVGEILSVENRKQMWIPEGFAHGFVVLSDAAEFLYKATDYWASAHERYIAWNDPVLNIEWPLTSAPILSVKDQGCTSLTSAEAFA